MPRRFLPLSSRIALSFLLLCGLCAHAADAPMPDRRIAVTIDDLPWQRIDRTAVADLASRHGQLMDALRAAAVPVVGFVNEDKLEVAGEVQPARVAMLRDWLDAGFDLGNHTYGHVDLHAVGMEAYRDARRS
jgi:peptidoglycan/xylan/chitin deacetylase (PgdA/CDA1 family)